MTVPMVVDMGDPMLFQQPRIALHEEARIADLNGVAKIVRECSQERIEAREELASAQAVALKLEQEGSGMGLEVGVSVGLQHQIDEGTGIKKSLVRFACIDARA